MSFCKILKRVFVLCSLLVLLPLGVQATTLYGVSLNGYNSTNVGNSSLYSVDTSTGAGTLIGDLGYAINSIAIDPTTGMMYGSTTNWSGAYKGLLQINPITGDATEIGVFGASFNSIMGLTFDSSGTLYGWHEPNEDDLVTINITTGAATTIGESGIMTGGQVMAVDNSDNLTMISPANNYISSNIYNINKTTGTASQSDILNFLPGSGGADFDPLTGLLWAAITDGRVLDSIIRVTDISNDSYIEIDTDINYLHALTFGDTSQTPIPEPATMLLFGLGLLGLAGVSRRKNCNKL